MGKVQMQLFHKTLDQQKFLRVLLNIAHNLGIYLAKKKGPKLYISYPVLIYHLGFIVLMSFTLENIIFGEKYINERHGTSKIAILVNILSLLIGHVVVLSSQVLFINELNEFFRLDKDIENIFSTLKEDGIFSGSNFLYVVYNLLHLIAVQTHELSLRKDADIIKNIYFFGYYWLLFYMQASVFMITLLINKIFISLSYLVFSLEGTAISKVIDRRFTECHETTESHCKCYNKILSQIECINKIFAIPFLFLTLTSFFNLTRMFYNFCITLASKPEIERFVSSASWIIFSLSTIICLADICYRITEKVRLSVCHLYPAAFSIF